MIVNRFDYHMSTSNRGFGVGLDILERRLFDRDGVEFADGLLALRRQLFRRRRGGARLRRQYRRSHASSGRSAMTGWG